MWAQITSPEIECRKQFLRGILVDFVEDPLSRITIEIAVRDLVREYVEVLSHNQD